MGGLPQKLMRPKLKHMSAFGNANSDARPTAGANTTATITGQDLKDWGLVPGPAFGLIIDFWDNWRLEHEAETLRGWLLAAQAQPEAYLMHPVVGVVAERIVAEQVEEAQPIALRPAPLPYTAYGVEQVEEGALKQMHIAMRLPVATAGALMPDAHQGYGLPIGGVLAADNAVIPYAVGVDIGCRMCLSVFPEPVDRLDEDVLALSKILTANTFFGRETSKRPADHDVLSDPRTRDTKLLRDLHERMRRQLGSSGGGNHFVEWGTVDITETDAQTGLTPGRYLGLLSHSGSRGFGASIADHYTKLAMATTPLPDEAKHLAWLGLDTELGQEYWQAMSLAGDYASACHHVIHDRIAVGLRSRALVRIENHHNFAWRELDADGVERIVHRKGATPAGAGVLGIIPGSMATPGFIVRGRGVSASLASASHGAGRLMSRTQAKKTISPADWEAQLKASRVTLLSASLDEAPDAYKDIHEVMAAQVELVDVLGSFQPRIVRMCGDKGFRERD